jgi:hypothetical protein
MECFTNKTSTLYPPEFVIQTLQYRKLVAYLGYIEPKVTTDMFFLLCDLSAISSFKIYIRWLLLSKMTNFLTKLWFNEIESSDLQQDRLI